MVLPRIPLNFRAIHLFSELELYLVYNLLGYAPICFVLSCLFFKSSGHKYILSA